MRKLLRVAVIAYVSYLVIALLVVTPALNVLPHWFLKDTYSRELRTGWVLFNPFTLSLDIHDAELFDDTGEPFLAFSEASVNLSLDSLWQPGWVFDALLLRDLKLDVVRLDPDEYNFSDLLAADAAVETPEAAPDAPLPALTVRDVDLHSATLALTDRTREPAYTSRWNDLRVRLTDVSTVFDELRPFSVEIEADGGGILQWQGDISVAGGTSSGHWSLAGFDLVNLWQFAKPWLAFELKQGRLSVEGDYRLDWTDTPAYTVSNGRISLSNLDIQPQRPQQLPDTAIGVEALDISGIAVDGATRKVALDTVTLEKLAASTWRDGAKVTLQDLFTVTLPESPATAEDSGPPWTVSLNKAQLRNGSLQWRSEYTDPQQLDITPIEGTVEHLTWPLSGDTRLSLGLSVNDQTQLSAQGTLALATGVGAFEYTLEALPLPWFNPILPKPLKATITGGLLALKGEAALQDFAPTTIALDVKIREFAARQAEEEVTLTGFDLLHLDGVAVDMTQHTLALRKLAVDNYTGRLHIRQDGSINAANVWKREVGDEAQQLADELTENKPWRFSLPLVQVSDSAIDFMDESLPIQFRTVIGDLEGEVRNLGSDPGTTATVDLEGSVDGYAPVALKGEIAPMASPADLDLRLTFDGVDMALLSPYTGTYAGYKIDRGLLDLDLHYTLNNNQLQGDNAIRIEKLKLGEKVASDRAVDLPLELALAILTDSNGVIDLAVPVKGDVKNPQFDIGSVISKAIINVITKAITAPFSLLAGLVDTEEDLQRINFSSGSAKLSDKNQEKLKELAAALSQRPQLSLVITGRLNLATDRARLQRNALRARLLEDGLSADEIKTRGPDWEKAIADLYEALPDRGAAGPEPSAREQATTVEKSIAIPDEQLTELAGQRAVAVKLFLLTDAGLAPERAVVGQSSVKDSENTFSGVELGIGT